MNNICQGRDIKSYGMFSSLVLLICRIMNTCKRINVLAFILRAVILQVGARQHNHTANIYFNEFVEQDDLESRGTLPGMHTRYTCQTKYITLSNQNGTISLFKEITYLSKVLRYHGPIIIAKLDSMLMWIWGDIIDCLPERCKNN